MQLILDITDIAGRPGPDIHQMQKQKINLIYMGAPRFYISFGYLLRYGRKRLLKARQELRHTISAFQWLRGFGEPLRYDCGVTGACPSEQMPGTGRIDNGADSLYNQETNCFRLMTPQLMRKTVLLAGFLIAFAGTADAQFKDAAPLTRPLVPNL